MSKLRVLTVTAVMLASMGALPLSAQDGGNGPGRPPFLLRYSPYTAWHFDGRDDVRDFPTEYSALRPGPRRLPMNRRPIETPARNNIVPITRRLPGITAAEASVAWGDLAAMTYIGQWASSRRQVSICRDITDR
jgi:hypothetical protein